MIQDTFTLLKGNCRTGPLVSNTKDIITNEKIENK